MFEPELFWANIPDRDDYLGFLDSLIPQCFLKDFKEPYCIWTGTGVLNASKFKDVQNLHLFLYEPLRITNQELSVELNCLKDFAITVYIPNLNIEPLAKNYPNLIIKTLDLFFIISGLTYFCMYKDNDNHVDHQDLIYKKFWCGNWRYTVHRHLIMCYLATLNGTYSWHFDCEYNVLLSNCWFDFKKCQSLNFDVYARLINGCNMLTKDQFSLDQLPFMPIKIKDLTYSYYPNNKKYAPGSMEFHQSYTTAFCSIITESEYDYPFGFLTEKTLSPILYFRPFVLVSSQHSLRFLKKYGFKTFNQWWDESYDHEEDHMLRMMKIFKVIDYLDSLSLNELKQIYADMLPTLKHNRNILKEIIVKNPLF